MQNTNKHRNKEKNNNNIRDNRCTVLLNKAVSIAHTTTDSCTDKQRCLLNDDQINGRGGAEGTS